MDVNLCQCQVHLVIMTNYCKNWLYICVLCVFVAITILTTWLLLVNLTDSINEQIVYNQSSILYNQSSISLYKSFWPQIALCSHNLQSNILVIIIVSNGWSKEIAVKHFIRWQTKKSVMHLYSAVMMERLFSLVIDQTDPCSQPIMHYTSHTVLLLGSSLCGGAPSQV